MTDSDFLKLSAYAGLALLGYRLEYSWNPIDILNRRMKVVRVSDGKNMGAMNARESAKFAYAEFLRLKEKEAISTFRDEMARQWANQEKIQPND
jgi:hypothetical protein